MNPPDPHKRRSEWRYWALQAVLLLVLLPLAMGNAAHILIGDRATLSGYVVGFFTGLAIVIKLVSLR